MRATDADRDVVLDVLRDAFVDGRLSQTEHDQRSGAALECRTIGEIAPLVSDLVAAGTSPVRATSAGTVHEQAVAKYRRDLRDSRNGWIFVSVLTVGIWAATSGFGAGAYFFWPVFPILGVGIGYLSTRLNAESRIEDIEEKLLEKRKRRGELE